MTNRAVALDTASASAEMPDTAPEVTAETANSSTEIRHSAPQQMANSSAEMANSVPVMTAETANSFLERRRRHSAPQMANSDGEAGEALTESGEDVRERNGRQSVATTSSSSRLRRLRLGVLLHQDLGAMPLSLLRIPRIVTLRRTSRRYKPQDNASTHVNLILR